MRQNGNGESDAQTWFNFHSSSDLAHERSER